MRHIGRISLAHENQVALPHLLQRNMRRSTFAHISRRHIRNRQGIFCIDHCIFLAHHDKPRAVYGNRRTHRSLTAQLVNSIRIFVQLGETERTRGNFRRTVYFSSIIGIIVEIAGNKQNGETEQKRSKQKIAFHFYPPRV